MEQEKLTALVRGVQNGDEAAFTELYQSFYNDIYYFARKTVGDADTACDITQETFVEVFRTIRDLREPAAFVTWMHRIAYHQCTRHFKKKKEILVEEDEDGNTLFDTLADESEDASPSDVYEKEELCRVVQSMVQELSEEQRAAVVLYYYDELPVSRIAEIQGVSEGTVKSRLNYARRAMKKSVEGYEEKTGTKLHGITFAGLIRLFLTKESMPRAAEAAVRRAVLAETVAAASASAAAVGGTAGFAAKLAALPLVVKILSSVAALSLVTGTAVGITALVKNDRPQAGFSVAENVTTEACGDRTSDGDPEDTRDGDTADTSASDGDTSSPDSVNGGNGTNGNGTGGNTNGSHVHTPVTDAARAATCTETGLTEGQHCSTCGEVLKQQESVPATGHTEAANADVAPTLTADGSVGGTHCTVCQSAMQAATVRPSKLSWLDSRADSLINCLRDVVTREVTGKPNSIGSALGLYVLWQTWNTNEWYSMDYETDTFTPYPDCLPAGWTVTHVGGTVELYDVLLTYTLSTDDWNSWCNRVLGKTVNVTETDYRDSTKNGSFGVFELGYDAAAGNIRIMVRHLGASGYGGFSADKRCEYRGSPTKVGSTAYLLHYYYYTSAEPANSAAYASEEYYDFGDYAITKEEYLEHQDWYAEAGTPTVITIWQIPYSLTLNIVGGDFVLGSFEIEA